MTAIDAAHAAMEAAPEDEEARLAFYARLAEVELFLLVEREAPDNALDPRVFALEHGDTVLVFDSEERLAEFSGNEAAYAALPGRRLVPLLSGRNLWLGLNLGVAPSAYLMGPDVLEWMTETLTGGAETTEAGIEALMAPAGLPERLLVALDRKLARAAGLARHAFLAAVDYRDGSRRHLVVIVGAAEGAEEALAMEIREALAFSGLEAAVLDIVFTAPSSDLAARAARVGLRFDLPQPEAPGIRRAPGSDPDTPPRLR